MATCYHGTVIAPSHHHESGTQKNGTTRCHRTSWTGREGTSRSFLSFQQQTSWMLGHNTCHLLTFDIFARPSSLFSLPSAFLSLFGSFCPPSLSTLPFPLVWRHSFLCNILHPRHHACPRLCWGSGQSSLAILCGRRTTGVSAFTMDFLDAWLTLVALQGGLGPHRHNMHHYDAWPGHCYRSSRRVRCVLHASVSFHIHSSRRWWCRLWFLGFFWLGKRSLFHLFHLRFLGNSCCSCHSHSFGASH